MMLEQRYENVNNFYTIVLLPLTEEDKQVIKKGIRNYYKVNVLLLPLLILIFFWRLWYFLCFLIFVLWYNIAAFFGVKKNELSLNNPKTILTGKVTKKEPPGDGTIIYLGPERFELTYANITFPVEVGDTVALHYSRFNVKQKVNVKQRGILLKVEKVK
jgi:co-chaperonin GroES (HSP10)